MSTPNKALTEAENKLTLLLMEQRGTATFDRVKLYIAKLTGGRLLSEYLRDDGVPVKERAALATTLIDILLTQAHDRLPELPPMQNGNRVPLVVLAQDELRAASVRGVEPMPEIQDDEQDDDEAEELPLSRAEIERIVRTQVRAELAGVLELVAKVLKETK